MHAEPREFEGQACAKTPIVTSSAPVSPSAVLISSDIKQSGLWLWQGGAPPSPSLPQPKSRDQEILPRIMPAAGWAGWIAVPAGLALAFLAVLMMPHPDRPVSADRPAAEPSSAPSPTVAHPIVAVTPAEPKKAQLDQVQIPSAPAAKIMAQGPEPPVAKGRAQRKFSRTASKTHTSQARRGPLFLTPGVLTPPPMTWHGGGY